MASMASMNSVASMTTMTPMATAAPVATMAPMSMPLGEKWNSTGWKVIVSTAVGFTLATTAVILRLASRWLCRKRLESNDYLILAAFPFKLAVDVCCALLVVYGLGQDCDTLPDPSLKAYLQLVFAAPMFYASTIALTKLSILSLYYVAFPVRYMRYMVWICSIFTVLWALAYIGVDFGQCTPLHKSWSWGKNYGTCIHYKAYYYGLQIPNIITDFAILFMPLKAVYDLHLPSQHAYAMFGIMSLAVITIAIDIVRLIALIELVDVGNFTRNQVSLWIWTNLEASVAILVACLPIMRPLLHPRYALQARKQRSLATEIGCDSYDEPSPQKPKDGSLDHKVTLRTSDDFVHSI